MRLFLPDHVHVARLGPDLVLIDVAADAYFCLADGAALMTLGDHGEVDVAVDETSTDLLAAGLLSLAPGRPRAGLPPRPTASVRGARPARAPSLARIAMAMRATFSARRRVSRGGFGELLETARGDVSAPSSATPDLIEAVAQFERLRPWLPVEGECLLRSYHLRAFLRACGLDASWVFGVRTWPFAAHCWLQVGETVLDEDLERLVAYTPIMAA